LDALAFLDGEDIIIEFEAYSSNFKKERHDASKCNLIGVPSPTYYNSPSGGYSMKLPSTV
jgi:hypothetical protein